MNQRESHFDNIDKMERNIKKEEFFKESPVQMEQGENISKEQFLARFLGYNPTEGYEKEEFEDFESQLTIEDYKLAL